MKNQLEAVKLFHQVFKSPISETPISDIPQDRKNLRYELMKEENEEYQLATLNNDIVEIADALGDMLYILCGTIIEHGLQHKIVEVFDEIQRSNMSKLGEDGQPIFREDGKILKGQNYSKPDIKSVLEKGQVKESSTRLSKLTPEGKHIVVIAALSGNEVIAVDGNIPWHLPKDFKRFKEVTSGHHIIMGRKTFDSLPGLLPNRTHVVITRDKDYLLNQSGRGNVIFVSSLGEAIEVCPKGTSFVIGGGEIYTQAIGIADELDLTIVDTMITGDNLTKFPPCEEHVKNFKMVESIPNKADEKHEFNFAFIRLKRF